MLNNFSHTHTDAFQTHLQQMILKYIMTKGEIVLNEQFLIWHNVSNSIKLLFHFIDRDFTGGGFDANNFEMNEREGMFLSIETRVMLYKMFRLLFQPNV